MRIEKAAAETSARRLSQISLADVQLVQDCTVAARP